MSEPGLGEAQGAQHRCDAFAFSTYPSDWLCAGLVLDEGLASQNNKFKFFYGERVPWCTDSL